MLIIPTNLQAQSLPDYFIPLRDAVYEQNLKADQIIPLYNAVKDKAVALSGEELCVLLSRCEYMMGRAFLYEERKEEADLHFSEGMSLAEKALKTDQRATGQRATDQRAAAWQMLAENLSYLCTVRSTAFMMANGLNVEKYSKNALALNKRNAAAQYMVAARWVYAPSPFHNYKKGLEMMEAIIAEGDMEKDDRFNVYLSIGYAYVQQKKTIEARPWFIKAQEVYPSNKYVQELLKKN
jgi:tetratricopeptide (TPR) repeat protein